MADQIYDVDTDLESPDGMAGTPRGRWTRAVDALCAPLLAERDRWPLGVPVGIGAGVALYFALTAEPPPWLGAAVLAAGLLAAVLGRRSLAVLALACALMSVAAGFAAAQFRTQWVAAPLLTREVGPAPVTGRVVAVERLAEGARVVLAELSIPRLAAKATPDRVRVRLIARHGVPPVGAVIRITAVLHPPQGPGEPGAFDFQRHAFFAGLGAVGYALSAPEVVAGPPPGLADRAGVLLEALRERIADRVAAAVEGAGEAAVTTALMNGEQTGIPEPLMQAMRGSGLAHLLSISGLHIALVAGIIMTAVRVLLALVPYVALRLPVKEMAAFAGMLAAVAYTGVVGAPVPTLRSVLMTGMVLAAVVVGRDPLSMRLVAFAGVAVMLMAPDSLLGASFQMSFAAVVALIAVYERISTPIARLRADLGWVGRGGLALAGIALTSVVATIATLPFGLYHFQTISLYGVLSNMIAIPVTSALVMPCSLAAYALMPLGWEGPALTAMGWGVWVVNRTAETVAALPGATLTAPAMPAWGLGLVAAGGLWAAVWQRPWRTAGLVVAAVGLASPFVVERPDVLVSAEGEVMAVRGADGRLSPSGRGGRRVVDDWTARDGRHTPGAPWPRAGRGAGGRLTCDAVGCLYRKDGHTIALSRVDTGLEEDCRTADAVITTVPVRRCAAPVVIDHWLLHRRGAHTLTVRPDGIRVESVGMVRGRRPWTIP